MEATLNGHAQDERQQDSNQAEDAVQAVQATQESLDQVRDILFGTQARDTERRFGDLESKVTAEFEAFREETRQSLAGLESFVKAELAALTQRLTGESNQRQEATGRLSQELSTARRELGENLQNTARGLSDEAKAAANKLADDLRNSADQVEKRIAGFDQQHAGADSEIRKELLAQAGALREELKANQAELQAIVDNLAGELRNSKTDRAALAGLFSEMAGKLQA